MQPPIAVINAEYAIRRAFGIEGNTFVTKADAVKMLEGLKSGEVTTSLPLCVAISNMQAFIQYKA